MRLKDTISYFQKTALLVIVLVISLPTFANELRLYGYLAWNVEKVFDELSIDDQGNTVKEDAPREISLASFNLMMQSQISEDFKVFVNLSGAGGETVEVANMWGEWTINPYFNIRLGKTYRRFGLYNEQLDAVPLYMGIEPPELFDKDHLMISRTTLTMFHGAVSLDNGSVLYSVSTDNGEGGPKDDQLPLGFDVRYETDESDLIFGVSGYSSNGETTSDVAVGEGSPKNGVLPWMSEDDFTVFGGFYEQLFFEKWRVQIEFWQAEHNATRDAEATLTVVQNAGLNSRQLSRFLLNDTAPATVNNIDANGDYDVSTWYLRTGYHFYRESGEWMPYFQWDHFKNEETIQNKDYGGDNEAGLSDDGEFQKVTVGLVYRPVPAVAFKLDASTHIQEFNGKSESYPELRFDASYIFGQ